MAARTLNVLLLALTLSLPVTVSALTVSSVKGGDQGVVQLNGKGFGRSCPPCRVVIDYGGGFRYSAEVVRWADEAILIRVPDLGRALKVTLQVETPAGRSARQPFRLLPRIVPDREITRPVTTRRAGDLLVFERSHNVKVGGKGDDRFDVSIEPLQCGQKGLAFYRARIVYRDRRFAEAQIVSAPNSGCVRCRPLVVRWYNEPTGRLTYQLHVYRREIEGICRDRVVR
ncbi:MAG: hypothetical protein Kow006_13910 [Gammaproteobacteria bacterium]